MRDEFVGFLRHADLMLAKAAEAAKQDWEGGEIMLSPQRAEEFNRIMKSIRMKTRDVATVGGNFTKIADMRRVVHL